MANYERTAQSPNGYLLDGDLFEDGSFISLGAATYPAGTVLGRKSVAVAGVAEVWTATPTAANDTDFGLAVHDANGDVIAVLEMTSDGDGTATEICDALRADAAANSALVAAGFVGSGTTTFILTGPAGVSFTVEEFGTGAWSSIVETTPSTTTAATNKWAPYVAGATDGSGVPGAVLHEEIVATGAGQSTQTRVLVRGATRDALTKVWTGGSPVVMSPAERDTLRAAGIVTVPETTIAEFDNA